MDAGYADDGSILTLDELGTVRSHTPGFRSAPRVLVDASRAEDRVASAVGITLSADGKRLLRWDDSYADVFVAADGERIGEDGSPLVLVARADLSSEDCGHDRVTFSADAELLVSYAQDSVCIWDAASGDLTSVINYDAGVRAAGIATGSAPLRVLQDRTLRTYTLAGDPIEAFELEGSISTAAAFSLDASTLFVFGPGTTGTSADLVALDTQDGTERWRSALRTDNPWAITPSRGGLVLVAGDRVYRVEDGTPVADDSPSHPSRTTDISPEGRNKLVVSELVGEWSLAGETARLFGSHSERVIALDVSRNGRHFASHGRSAVLWEIGSDFAASTPLAQGIGADASWNVAIAPDGGSFVVSGDNVALFWLDDSVGNDPPPPSIDCLSPDWAFSPDGELLAGSRYGSTVEIRSAADFRLLREVEANNCGGGAAFSPDGKLLATGSLELFETDTWTKLWDRSNGRMPEPFTETAVEFSPDGRELVTTPCGFNEPCTSERYAASDGTYLGVLPALQGDRVRYSPEGHWVVSQGRALHLPSGRSLELDPDATVAAFTTDGDIIAGLVDGSLVRYCRDDD